MLTGLGGRGLGSDTNQVVESGQVRFRLSRKNALAVIGQEFLHPIAEQAVKRLNEVGEEGFHGFSDGVEQHIHRRWAPPVPRQTHVLRSLNHGSVGLFNEQRSIEKSAEDHLCLILPTQTGHQSIPSIEEGLVMVEHTGFAGVIDGPDAPHGVKGVLHHQGFALFSHLLIGRVESDQVDVGLDQLTEEGVDGGNRRFVQPRKEHFNVAVVTKSRVKNAVLIFRTR